MRIALTEQLLVPFIVQIVEYPSQRLNHFDLRLINWSTHQISRQIDLAHYQSHIYTCTAYHIWVYVKYRLKSHPAWNILPTSEVSSKHHVICMKASCRLIYMWFDLFLSAGFRLRQCPVFTFECIVIMPHRFSDALYRCGTFMCASTSV